MIDQERQKAIETIEDVNLIQNDCKVNGWVLEGYPIAES